MAVSKTFIVVLLVSMIFSGASNTIVYKAQNSYHTEQGGQFNHPFMQAVTMFFGEFICIFLYFYYKKYNKEQYQLELQEAKEKGLETKMNYFWLLIPASADFLTSNLQYIALNYVAPSLYQMLRGGVILITALFTVVFLKKKLYQHNYIGCALVVVGIGLVGASKYIFPSSNSNSNNNSAMSNISIILILVSLFTNGILFVSEEKLFSKYYLHPFQVVGTEGFWGLSLYAIVLPLLACVPCASGLGDLCLTYDGTSRLEQPGQYFSQFAHNGVLAFYIVLGVFTIAVFNICGVSVTKHISSLARSIVDVTRTVVVWVVSIVVTETYGQDNPNWQWETVAVGPILIEALGFIILVCGNLVYNKVIILPFAKPPTAEAEALLQSIEKENQISMQNQPQTNNYSRRSSESGAN
ncbi:nucleotide-sugar transporter (macronuclear) [Tetrahymena thermophila SB210]|uniref:Nucleotide-sugar transporter n=1 Tax=Tetrahymena thermophila (strain SB210) TaxID=312017 RepID=I7MN16_TETTS|nr:nucleotide-sugar transporter [Tetrahymena thermophila SB210]EAS07726.3 nucleotide-sugar transporter [Tetrahymena thermophila SB210]|eukprot:XP_001027968.3 nucleotide-sugar transporter [Tetrahymena thermophila SB210]